MEQNVNKGEGYYVAPTQRWIENGHIFLWLLKDTCWVLGWKLGGIFMIFPTMSVAFYILLRSRHLRAELFHNIAICLWISANTVWMISEFLMVDEEYKKYAAVLFGIGIATLLFYYIFFFAKDRRFEKEQEDGLKNN